MKNLFKSKTSFDTLLLLSQFREKPLGLADIARRLGKDKANVTRELEKLVAEQIVSVVISDKKKGYLLNDKYDGIDELVTLLGKSQKADFERKFQREWLMAEDIPNMDPYFSQIWANCFVKDFVSPSGRAYERIAVIHEGYHLWINFDRKDAFAVAEHLVNRFVDEHGFMRSVNEGIVHMSDRLRAFAESVPEEHLHERSNAELLKLNQEHISLHSEYYQWTWIPAASDMFANLLTDRSKEMLRSLGVPEDSVNDDLTTLTQPTRSSLMKVEQEGLIDIALEVLKDADQRALFQELFRKFKEEDVKQFGLYTHSPEYEAQFERRVADLIGGISPSILDALQDHYAKYFYTKFIFTEEQGVYSFEHYLKELVRLVSQGDGLLRERKRLDEDQANILEHQRRLAEKLQLSDWQKEFFAEWGEFMVTKIYRRYAQLLALYKMSGILEELGRRIGLSLKEVRFLTREELERAVTKRELPNLDELRSRLKFSVYYADAEGFRFLTGTDAERAAACIRGKEENMTGIRELKGQTGCRGRAVGTVRVINFSHEMQKMQEGDVLVSIATQPDLVPAMRKAAAFVTEQGGVTSHAAIVAREMNIPCVIGTRIATKVLKDGMKVEVDATKGLVRIIE